MIDSTKNKDNFSIDPTLIKSINQIILDNIKAIPVFDKFRNPIVAKIYPGNYKTEPNYVIHPDGTVHEYVQPFDVPAQIENLCAWVQEREKERDLHPILTASILHYNFVRIHPFPDGNGRGARVLMNLHLMRHDYYPAIIQFEKRQKYLDRLKACDKGDLNPFADFIVDSVIETQKNVLSTFEKYIKSPINDSSVISKLK